MGIIATCNMASSTILCFVLVLVASARASIEGGHCSDVSFFDHIKYSASKAECCANDNNKLRCEEKEEEVCVDVTEMICDVNAYADCQVEENSSGPGPCEGGYKNFDMRDCEEQEFKEAHIKQVPVCKNVTKNNCVTDWEVDDNGNKVWTGLENCTPVTWEECTIEDKEVDFPTVKTDCGVVSQIKYFDYTPQPGSSSSVSTNCSPRGSVSCRPVTRTDCIQVTYTDCSMGGGDEGGCNRPDVFLPTQEKVHQKKCLD